MFDLSGLTGMGASLSGFMGGISSLGWTPPNIPTPTFGDAFNLNSVFNSVLGPNGLSGVGGAPLSLTGGFSGAIGGDMAGWQQAMIPTYGVTMQKTPVYNYQEYAFSNRDQSGKCSPVFVTDANNDGQINTDDLVRNTSTTKCSCHHYQQNNGWQNIKTALADQNGMVKGDAMDKVKIWYDDNKDGQIGTDELRQPCDYGIVGIDTQNGALIRKNLLGYQCTPKQTVTGYYSINNYSSNTGVSNQQFNWQPLTAGSSLAESLTGTGSFGSLPASPNYTGMSNAWGLNGLNGGQGWSFGWNGSGWGNGYA